MRRALTMAERLQAGTVWVNTYRAVSYLSPFGGYKRIGHRPRERAGDDQGIPADEERLDLDRDRRSESVHSEVVEVKRSGHGDCRCHCRLQLTTPTSRLRTYGRADSRFRGCRAAWAARWRRGCSTPGIRWWSSTRTPRRQAADGTRRDGGRVGGGRGVEGRSGLHQPADAADRPGGEPRRQGHPQGLARQDADRSVDDRARAWPRSWRKAAAERGVAWVDSPVSGGVTGATKGTLAVMVSCPKATFDRDRAAAEDLRQDVLRRRQAGPGADRQAGEQPARRGGARRVVRSRGDGRQGRARREGADRHHQRRQRPQQRHAGQVPARRSCRARSISASRPGFRTRTCGCASTRPRRLACRWSPAPPCGRCWPITQAKFGADSDFT